MYKGAFLIALKKENSELAQKIEQLYPKSYKISDTVFLVSADGLAGTVAENVGVRNDAVESGVVFRLEGSYPGCFQNGLWEWLKEQERLGAI